MRPSTGVGFLGRLLCCVALLTGMGRPAPAAEAVDLLLVLAVDVSYSIDDEEARLQRQGYVAAFRDARVVRTIQSGRQGRIAVLYMEWAGEGRQRIIADWTLIGDAAGAGAFADVLDRAAIGTTYWTSISGAIDFAVPLFDRAPVTAPRRIVDVSGDGTNNSGRRVTLARDAAVQRGITINGLPIVNDRPTRGGRRQEPNLDLYYRDCVIGGPHAFYVVANGFEDYGQAVRRKLIREIAGLAPPARPWPAAAREAPPCDFGERWFRQRLRSDDP